MALAELVPSVAGPGELPAAVIMINITGFAAVIFALWRPYKHIEERYGSMGIYQLQNRQYRIPNYKAGQ